MSTNAPNDALPRGYHDEPSTVQLHRAIGGYITIFSELVATMRHHISKFLEPNRDGAVDNSQLLDILFSTMTANPITESFFAMASHIGELNESEVLVRNSLKRSVRKHVDFRNDLAHADWSIGWMRLDTSETVPASAHRIKSREGVPQYSNLNIQTNDIIYKINDLNGLRVHVKKFGSGCLARQRNLDQRVSDLLEPVTEADSGRILVQEVT